MRNWKRIIRENRFQFFFFVAMFALLVTAVIVSITIEPVEHNAPIEDPIEQPDKPTNPGTGDVVEIVEETFITPISEREYKVVRKFFEKDDTKENQSLSLINFNNTFRTSQGTAYAKLDGDYFDVISTLSGTVIEVKKSPLFDNCVVIEHDNNVKTYYYGLSEVSVTKGVEVGQGTKLGKSGFTEFDKEAKNHVYFQVTKNGKYLNPEKLIGKTTKEI